MSASRGYLRNLMLLRYATYTFLDVHSVKDCTASHKELTGLTAEREWAVLAKNVGLCEVCSCSQDFEVVQRMS